MACATLLRNKVNDAMGDEGIYEKTLKVVSLLVFEMGFVGWRLVLSQFVVNLVLRCLVLFVSHIPFCKKSILLECNIE